MADDTTRRSRSERMVWIIGALVLVLLLLFAIFGYGNRTPSEDGVETAPAIGGPAPTADPETDADPAPVTIE